MILKKNTTSQSVLNSDRSLLKLMEKLLNYKFGILPVKNLLDPSQEYFIEGLIACF